VLSELSMLDHNLAPIAGGMRDATIALEEVAFDLSRYLDKLDLDPAEAAEVEERLNTLNRILNKYGRTVEEALAHRAELARQIAELEQAGDDLSSLHSQIAALKKELNKLGDELSARRHAAAKRLKPLIEKELAELGMEKATFEVSLVVSRDPLPSGLDQIEFIARTNPGQLPQPLRKIASGGELSRIMLALKGILAQGDRVSVLVFDEIDANVGGRLGSVIGNKLRKLAGHHQVLCITHLPQIASYADRHLTVRKAIVGDKTQTTVRTMDGAERLQELAEMIGGQRITDTTRAQAKELLDAATAEFAVQPEAPAPAASSPTAAKPPPAVRPSKTARKIRA
jgi:DNA repair protein RecN (Recombination protein N)